MLFEIGLCIAVYDVLRIGDAQLHQGSSCQHTLVEFRIVVFRRAPDPLLWRRPACIPPRESSSIAP